MKCRRFWISVGSIMAVFVFGIFFALSPYRICASLIAKEYLSPTTTIMPPLPEQCAIVNETPPSALFNIVNTQRAAYSLELQNIVTCRTSAVLLQKDPDFLEKAFDTGMGNKWLPLYVGCCSYQFRRHVIVMASQQDNAGSTIVIATLIHSRWNYLHFVRLHCDEKLERWL